MTPSGSTQESPQVSKPSQVGTSGSSNLKPSPASEASRIQKSSGKSEIVAVSASSFSGPLPNPDILAGYEKTLPGAADRIIRMAENEQKERHKFMHRSQVYGEVFRVAGLLFAFLLAAGGMALGAFLIYKDKSMMGFSVFLVSVATLIGAAIYKHHTETHHKEDKMVPET